MARVTVRSLEKMQQLIISEGHALLSDEPADGGGDGLGPTPYELLLAALGS